MRGCEVCLARVGVECRVVKPEQKALACFPLSSWYAGIAALRLRCDSACRGVPSQRLVGPGDDPHLSAPLTGFRGRREPPVALMASPLSEHSSRRAWSLRGR